MSLSSSIPSLATPNSELSTISSIQPVPVLLSGEVDNSEGVGAVPKQQGTGVLDLASVHNILMQQASTLQAKVDWELEDISSKLGREMKKSISSLEKINPASLLPLCLLPNSQASEIILAIHRCKDKAVSALITQAEMISNLPRNSWPAHLMEDFSMASSWIGGWTRWRRVPGY